MILICWNIIIDNLAILGILEYQSVYRLSTELYKNTDKFLRIYTSLNNCICESVRLMSDVSRYHILTRAMAISNSSHWLSYSDAFSLIYLNISSACT
jgi:hypothetical protein